MAVSGRKAEKEYFSSVLSRGSEEDYETFCQPCDRDDIRLPAFGFCTNCAEHLCQSCFIHHKRAKPSSHHVLLDIHTMPKTQQVSSTSTGAAQSEYFTTPCHKHTKEMLKFFCHDHKALLCSVCVALDHPRIACQVNYIPDVSKQSLNSKEYTDTLKDLDMITKEYHKITAVLKENIARSNNSLVGVLADIKKFRKKINQRMEELENEVEERVKFLQQEYDKRLKATETECNDARKLMKASSDVIKQLNTSNEADRLFMELKSAEQLIKDNKKRLSELASPEDVRVYNFQPNPELASTFQKVAPLGTLTFKSSKSIPNSVLDVRSTRFSHTISAKKPEETWTCFISGMILLTPSKVIFTDSYNQSVKMFDLNQNGRTDQLKLPAQPWDITSMTSDNVAVTLPGKQTIQFVSSSSNKLSLKRKVKVDAECFGISCYQEKFAVTFLSPKKLQIIDLKGKVLTTVSAHSSGKDIFIEPNYVTSNSHSIYVSDQGMYSVIRLNWQGELIGRYSDTRAPQGLTMLEDGSLLVCEYWDGNIRHITGDLTKGNVVLRDLKRPETLCWCGANNKLYISCDTKDEKYDDYIHVFNVI
ncbi:uncharacterized protein LOC123544247 [Mercenaria mercenaria]|uniref:uncharacterized protein LOC123544247 n=1 Tax=Mercenaria mercenaria TaxID=6596 RepID=UPI00234F2431|nr:uncharacterized protein LOC123544247 [Mercenaria mercenaria]